MRTTSVCIALDPNHLVHTLQNEAVETLNHSGAEVVLDFSSVARIDPGAARAMEELADLAERASVQVVLRAVPIDIYRVLKCLRLAQRFAFLS